MLPQDLIQAVADQNHLPPEQVRQVVVTTLAALHEAMVRGEVGPVHASDVPIDLEDDVPVEGASRAPGQPPAAPAMVEGEQAAMLALPGGLLRWPARRIARLEQQVRAAAPVTTTPEEADEETLDDLEIRNLLRVLADWRALEERALPASELQRQLGVSRQRLQQLRADGRLIGLRIPMRRELYYPVWQFAADGTPLAALPRLLSEAEAAHLELLALDALMTRPRAGGGSTPADLLRRGGEEQVLGIIRAAGDQGA